LSANDGSARVVDVLANLADGDIRIRLTRREFRRLLAKDERTSRNTGSSQFPRPHDAFDGIA
jgi:hypothetical protein